MALFLVTGAAGFIGSSLVRALLERGISVRGFDDLSTGKRENLTELLGKMELKVGSILDQDALKAACQGIDAVLHQAGLPYFVARGENAFASHAVNVNGTMNLLEAAREAGVKRFVFASSATVYGDNPATPKTEELTPEPNSPYSVQKLCCEHYLKCFQRMYGMETVALRYFNVFGPRQDPNSPLSGVVSRFSNQILKGEEITLQGDGEQTRDFNFVGNTVEANILAATASAEQVAGRVFNVASGEPMSMNQLIAKLEKLSGLKAAVKRLPARDGDIRHADADLTLAKKELGYLPSVKMEQGLALTLDYYRSHLREKAQHG